MLLPESTETMKEYYEGNDYIVKEVLKQNFEINNINPLCRKNCPLCCYQLILVSPLEALTAFNYFVMKYKNTEYEKKFLERGFKLDEKTREIMVNTLGGIVDIQPEKEDKNFISYAIAYNLEKIPCIYLENNECLIYPFRPSVCRFQFNFNNVKNCDFQNYPNPFKKNKGIMNLSSLDSRIIEGVNKDLINVHNYLNIEFGFVTLLTCASLILSNQFFDFFGKEH